MLRPDLRMRCVFAGGTGDRFGRKWSVIMLRSDLRFSEIQRKLPTATWSRSPCD